MLKKSERFAKALYLTLTIFLNEMLVGTFITIALANDAKNPETEDIPISNYLNGYFLADMIGNILCAIVAFLISHILLKLNKPLMTRKDLSSGKEMSMLMFVKSKQQMRKIFDSDTDKQVSFISQRSVNDSKDQNDFEAEEPYDEVKRQTVY
jgi:hypothetical protein